MTIKYIHYKNPEVYAIYYSSNQTIYYNIDFNGKAHMIIIK